MKRGKGYLQYRKQSAMRYIRLVACNMSRRDKTRTNEFGEECGRIARRFGVVPLLWPPSSHSSHPLVFFCLILARSIFWRWVEQFVCHAAFQFTFKLVAYGVLSLDGSRNPTALALGPQSNAYSELPRAPHQVQRTARENSPAGNEFVPKIAQIFAKFKTQRENDDRHFFPDARYFIPLISQSFN